MIQYPNKFEYNILFIIHIARSSCSGWYSTFLGNSEKDRHLYGMHGVTTTTTAGDDTGDNSSESIGVVEPSFWDTIMYQFSVNNKYRNIHYIQPLTSTECQTRNEYSDKCVLGSIITSFESLRIWDELYFGKKKKRKKRKKRKKKITLVVQKTFDRNIKKSTSGRTMEKGSSCSKVEKKAENEKEQENKGT